MSEVEKENVIGPGNILMAVEDIDVAWMKISEAAELIALKPTAKYCILKIQCWTFSCLTEWNISMLRKVQYRNDT
jgi:hypothetical protein